MQENYASKKQKYATDASCHCTRKCKDRLDSIFYATHAIQACVFEWKVGFSQLPLDSPYLFVLDLCIFSEQTKTFHILFFTIPPCPSQTG